MRSEVAVVETGNPGCSETAGTKMRFEHTLYIRIAAKTHDLNFSVICMK